MTLYDFFNDGQAGTRAPFEFALGMQTLENLKYELSVLGVDPDPVVPDKKDISASEYADLYVFCLGLVEFNGIRKEVMENLPDSDAIT